jgi:predicted DNA-binding protein with PD1-like motif
MMKASEGHIGRIFVLRLEEGDVVPDCIERFAEEKGISVGQVILLGGVGGGEVVVGPRDKEMPPQPIPLPVDGPHDVVGAGVIATVKDGKPALHIHAALGRSGHTMTGCLFLGVETWLAGEVVICEILGTKAARILDKKSEADLLEII